MKQLKFILITLISFYAANAAANPMDLDDYSNRAEVDAGIEGRCVYKPISIPDCHMRIDWAVNNNLMTRRAADWGKQHGFYPIIDFFDQTIRAVCKCGCFEQDTMIRVFDNDGQLLDVAAKDLDKKAHQLVALSSNATLSSLTTESFDVKYRTVGPEVPDLYVFSFDDGSEIKVTQHHGMFIQDGTMKPANEVQVKDMMVRADGVKIAVTKISREPTAHDVYNFETSGTAKVNQIIVANNIFIGGLAFQNQLRADMGKVIIRQ